ncbi:hypothetical protein MMC21_008421 [Puttea exsequens]|nr:hypothetical protein [Puttea exsequens]
MPPTLNITFGLELECIVRYDPADYYAGIPLLNDPSDNEILNIERLVRLTIAKMLRWENFPVSDDGDASKSSGTWRVGSDRTIHLDLEWQAGVEIRSPAYNFSQEAMREVARAVTLVKENFDVHMNDTCGLHVHVGNQRRGFPLQTLKNFCMLATIFKPQLDSLHGPERVLTSEFCRGFNRASEGSSPWDTAVQIQAAETRQELVERIVGGVEGEECCFAYNLCPLLRKPHYDTIEFRQHEGTVDQVEICRWLQLTCGLVAAAHRKPFDDLVSVIEEFAFSSASPRETVMPILRKLGLTSSADYYEKRQLVTYKRPDHYRVDRVKKPIFTVEEKMGRIAWAFSGEVLKAVEDEYRESKCQKDADKFRLSRNK